MGVGEGLTEVLGLVEGLGESEGSGGIVGSCEGTTTPRAFATFNRPPVAFFVVSPVSTSTPLSKASRNAATVASGEAALTRAAAPATCGVAIEVPL